MPTITVETGAGVAGANSYISVADIGTYFDDVGKSRTVWDALTATQQEQATLRAARYIEAHYPDRWDGIRVDRDQAMQWPRDYVRGFDGVLVASTTVPNEVIWAQAELAHRTADGTELFSDVLAATAQTVETEKQVGELKTRTRYSGAGAAGQTLYHYVERLLAPYLIGTPSTVHLRRA